MLNVNTQLRNKNPGSSSVGFSPTMTNIPIIGNDEKLFDSAACDSMTKEGISEQKFLYNAKNFCILAPPNISSTSPLVSLASCTSNMLQDTRAQLLRKFDQLKNQTSDAVLLNDNNNTHATAVDVERKLNNFKHSVDDIHDELEVLKKGIQRLETESQKTEKGLFEVKFTMDKSIKEKMKSLSDVYCDKLEKLLESTEVVIGQMENQFPRQSPDQNNRENVVTVAESLENQTSPKLEVLVPKNSVSLDSASSNQQILKSGDSNYTPTLINHPINYNDFKGDPDLAKKIPHEILSNSTDVVKSNIKTTSPAKEKHSQVQNMLDSMRVDEKLDVVYMFISEFEERLREAENNLLESRIRERGYMNRIKDLEYKLGINAALTYADPKTLFIKQDDDELEDDMMYLGHDSGDECYGVDDDLYFLPAAQGSATILGDGKMPTDSPLSLNTGDLIRFQQETESDELVSSPEHPKGNIGTWPKTGLNCYAQTPSKSRISFNMNVRTVIGNELHETISHALKRVATTRTDLKSLGEQTDNINDIDDIDAGGFTQVNETLNDSIIEYDSFQSRGTSSDSQIVLQPRALPVSPLVNQDDYPMNFTLNFSQAASYLPSSIIDAVSPKEIEGTFELTMGADSGCFDDTPLPSSIAIETIETPENLIPELTALQMGDEVLMDDNATNYDEDGIAGVDITPFRSVRAWGSPQHSRSHRCSKNSTGNACNMEEDVRPELAGGASRNTLADETIGGPSSLALKLLQQLYRGPDPGVQADGQERAESQWSSLSTHIESFERSLFMRENLLSQGSSRVASSGEC